MNRLAEEAEPIWKTHPHLTYDEQFALHKSRQQDPTAPTGARTTSALPPPAPPATLIAPGTARPASRGHRSFGPLPTVRRRDDSIRDRQVAETLLFAHLADSYTPDQRWHPADEDLISQVREPLFGAVRDGRFDGRVTSVHLGSLGSDPAGMVLVRDRIVVDSATEEGLWCSEVSHLYVLPRNRGEGIGAALLAHAVREARRDDSSQPVIAESVPSLPLDGVGKPDVENLDLAESSIGAELLLSRSGFAPDSKTGPPPRVGMRRWSWSAENIRRAQEPV